MPIQETSVNFPVTRGSGPRLASKTLVFPRQVTKAVAAIRGYQIGYHAEDHHVGLLQVELSTTVNGAAVVIGGRLGCRDWSGDWDDEYTGSIQATVFAELEPVTAPPPRGDLQIQDVEVNQATQFFRSEEHLDSGNVMPDNSIPLVGGKMTGLRFYVDYDAAAGLPPIATLSGEVEIRSGGATTILTPLADITPRAATEIDRAQVGHTLNFAIPPEWCRGRLDISCQVFDKANPALRSGRFQRTLQFVDVNPLRVYGVGVNYTGMGLDLPAPNLAALLNTFNYTRKVWPTGDVLSSGYTTISFGANLAGVAANGCGSGFNALLDQLQDLKGDSDDLVYGVLPIGTPLTGVGGCGGSGAGAGMVGGGVTAAHEAGHACGRKHAPCDDSTRCDTPANTDDDYPTYGNYPSDSIGEFGFDPAANVVFDPASSFDMMGYSNNNWISPYQYRSLFAKGDPQPYQPSSLRRTPIFGFAAAQVALNALTPGRDRPEWIRRRQPLLFLSLWVDRDKVTLAPSFTYDAHLRRAGPDSDYEVHLEDKDNAVLACVQLQQGCAACDQHCGPIQLRGEVPWDPSATKLILRRNGEDVESWPVEEPPKLTVTVSPNAKRGVVVKWAAAGGVQPLQYLLQWRDYDGTWRGVAPRTTKTEMVLPDRFRFARQGKVSLRLLAVHLLHTATEDFEIGAADGEPATTIEVEFFPDTRAYRATATDPMGRSMPSDDLVWFDEAGGEIARGAELVLARTARQGVATVRRVGQGLTSAEGFALLDPDSVADAEICGCRPAGAVARRVLSDAKLM